MKIFGQVKVSATVDINRISQNETIGFKVLVVNGDGIPSVDISPIKNSFKIVSGPAQQTNIQWVNGSMTSSRSLSWTLLAIKKGRQNIPSLKVMVDGQVYKTKPIGVTVKRGAGRAQMANLFIEAKPSKKEVFLGEQVTVAYKIFTRLSLSVENIDYPKSVGFWNEDIQVSPTVRWKDTQINGAPYKVAILYKSAMFPTQTGELYIDPMTAICNVEIPSKSRSRGVFNDPFFNSMFRETQRQFIKSDTIKISVKPYPVSTPLDFTGAVGDFKVSAALDTNVAKMNEAVTLYLKINGTGNLNQFSIQPISFPESMEVFPPKSTFKRDEFRDQITGEQLFEYILIPRSAGEFRLNPIRLSYFNPATETFSVAKSEPLVLRISSNENSNLASINFNKENIKLIGRDIRYINNNIPNWKNNKINQIPIWILGTYFLTAAVFLFPLGYSKTKSHGISNLKNKKSKRAHTVASKRLSKAHDNPYSSASLILYEYLESKLFLKSNKLDPMSIEDVLRYEISDKLLLEVIAFAKLCDAGQFGPDSKSRSQEIQNNAARLISSLDKELL